jgi:3-isopropylmalate/(R)-2-methylmalate dehydratase small subunit
MECENILKNIDEGDSISINLEKGIIRNETQDKSFKTNPIPKFLMSILQKGGLIEHLKKEIEYNE